VIMEYYLIIVICLFTELSTRINTGNLVKKFGLLLMILGAIIYLQNKPNSLILYGIMCYISIDFINAYIRKDRRKSIYG
jgi:type III secretory pathway component EscR